MESSTIAAYIPHNSKKRVFTEPEVMEIEPSLADRTAKMKAKGKQKQVVHHEIIDVDMDDDCDVALRDGVVESRKQMKRSVGISLGLSSALKLESKEVAVILKSMEVASNKKGKEISVEPGHSLKGFNSGSNNFFDLDDYTYDDDYSALQSHFDKIDDYSALQSHFDKIDFPAGIEASFPGFPDLVPKKKESPVTPLVTSNSQMEASVSQLNRVDPWFSSSKNNTVVHEQSTYYDPKKKGNPVTPYATSNSQLGASVSQLNRVDPWLSSRKKNTAVHGWSTYSAPKHIPAQTMHSNFTQIGSSNYLSNNSTTPVQPPTPYPSSLAMKAGYPLGTPSGWHGSLAKNQMKMNEASGTGGVYSMNGMLLGQDATVNGPSSVSSNPKEISSSLKKLVDGDVRKRYESFKKFDTVVDHSDHYYFGNQHSASRQPPKNWAKKIQEEWRILEKDLPDTIFVRAYESRMDLLRAVIIGAEGTPYHDGLFFFDVCFPSGYPAVPPLVHYHSGGLRINPNLYNCGKVCLSLLNTWSGGHKERWLPGTSTMLQVLVSIQGLILNAKPYFNEPGYESSSGSAFGETSSLQYNENTLILSLKTMVYTMNRPPKHFEDLVIGHFQHRVRDILLACKAYTEGVRVGCLVSGGVQDVDEDGNSCSLKFKQDVGSYIKTLIAAFKNIGAKEAGDFSFPSVTNNSLLSAPAPAPVPTLTPTPTPALIPPSYGNFPYGNYSHHDW